MTDRTLVLSDIFEKESTNRYISTFCTRVCHDLLGPAGAMSMMIDSSLINSSSISGNQNVEQSKHMEKLEECSDRLLLYIDILRRAYGFSSSSMNLVDFGKITKEMFGDKIDLSQFNITNTNKFDISHSSDKAHSSDTVHSGSNSENKSINNETFLTNSLPNLCRCMVWLFFKAMDKSRISISFNQENGNILIDCSNFYFTDQEIDFVKDKPVDLDAYIIYLILFLRYASDGSVVKIDMDGTSCKINIKENKNYI